MHPWSGPGRAPSSSGPYEVATRSPALPFALLALLAWGPAASADPAPLRWTPADVGLGSFSTIEPLECRLSASHATVQVRCDRAWRLELRLREPFRRGSDGLVLAPDRPGAVGPAPAILDLRPWIGATGDGTRRQADFDWRDLSRALQASLGRGDPPGSYEGTLLTRLLDAASGEALSEIVPLTVRFEIAPWVRILGQPLPDFEVNVDGREGESQPEVLEVVSNAAWRVALAGKRRNDSPGEEADFRLDALTACASAGGRWRCVGPACLTLRADGQEWLAGDAPEPFSLATAEIPVVIRYRGNRILTTGRYGAALRFVASVAGPHP
jgi:hypothetical protein